MTAAASAGICAEANGLVRQQFAAIEAEHRRFIAAANSLTPKLYGDLARGTTNTRNRAAAQIRSVLGRRALARNQPLNDLSLRPHHQTAPR